MEGIRIFFLFMLLAAVHQAWASNEVACPMDAMICPDGSSVSRVAPNCEFAPCPAANAEAASDGGEADLPRCEKDADCIVVPYSSCCGSTKRTINREKLSDYQVHPEWQNFSGPVCAVIGICPSDKNVTQARCAHEPGKDTGTCELIYPSQGVTP